MNLSDLCKAAETYILSISTSNKSGAYSPSGSLANGGTVKTYTLLLTHCPAASLGTNTATVNVTQTVKTNASIDSAYLAKADNTRITNDWNAFKNTYISKMKNANDTISLTSVFVFIYLVRCFIDARFHLFTDAYNTKYVWLYNTTTTVDYKVSSSVVTSNFVESSEITKLSTIIAALADQVSNRSSYHILSSTSTSTKA